MNISILEAIIASVDIYRKKEITYKHNLLVFFLLNFGLFNAYYMFVPYVYSALWIYFCYEEYKRQNKLFTKKTFVILFVTLLLPFALGYIYNIEYSIYGIIISRTIDLSNLFKNSDNLINEKFAVEGYIYINLFSNMILLLPYSIIAIWKNWKENKAVALMTIFNILFIILLFIGNKFDKVSDYYLSKNYFALSLFLFYLTYKGLLITYEKSRYIPSICIVAYIVILIITLLFGNTEITDEIKNIKENALQVTDIYVANKKYF